MKGKHTNVINELEEYLDSAGWNILMHDSRIKEWAMMVDFSNKRASSNVPKAWAMRNMLVELVESEISKGVYRFEIHDDKSISFTEINGAIVPLSMGERFNVRESEVTSL